MTHVKSAIEIWDELIVKFNIQLCWGLLHNAVFDVAKVSPTRSKFKLYLLCECSLMQTESDFKPSSKFNSVCMNRMASCCCYAMMTGQAAVLNSTCTEFLNFLKGTYID